MYPKFLKRTFDIIGAVIGLLVSFPILFVTGILLALVNRGTPFFFQDRPGKDGEIFKIIKFKTMNDKRGKNGKLLPDHERIHPIGQLIRSLSIDELPQMINILLGQMSFIGPRPLLKEYLPLYTPQQALRHNVRPGMTGWAQVNGRNAISWEQKFEYDIWYIQHVNFRSDVKIFWMTIQKIIARDGINSERNLTMIPFDIYYQQIKSSSK